MKRNETKRNETKQTKRNEKEMKQRFATPQKSGVP